MSEQRHDDLTEREWMRRLERGRLDALSISEGEDLPGPGAVAAGAYRTAPLSTSRDPREWYRELERDRLMMLATDTDTEYPGPGAVGMAGGAMKAGANPAAAAQEMAQAVKQVKEIIPILDTRGRIWMMLPTWFFVIPLMILPFHKIMFDGRIKDVARKIKEAVTKSGVPMPPQGQLLVRIAPYLPSIEWAALLFLYGALAAIVMIMLVVIGFAACPIDPGCLKDMIFAIGRKVVDLFKF